MRDSHFFTIYTMMGIVKHESKMFKASTTAETINGFQCAMACHVACFILNGCARFRLIGQIQLVEPCHLAYGDPKGSEIWQQGEQWKPPSNTTTTSLPLNFWTFGDHHRPNDIVPRAGSHWCTWPGHYVGLDSMHTE